MLQGGLSGMDGRMRPQMPPGAGTAATRREFCHNKVLIASWNNSTTVDPGYFPAVILRGGRNYGPHSLPQ